MLGYIYYITNKITNKQYIGGTVNLASRKERHLAELRHGYHHSQKLQRAFDKYGEAAFEWSWEIYEVADEAELFQIEEEKIKEFDTYYNGYNCTFGGEGSRRVFDYETSCLLWHILQRYSGVHRQIARYFGCDHTVIDDLAKNTVYQNIEVNEADLSNLITCIGLTEDNLNENYIPHNTRKLTEQDCWEILSIVQTETGYEKLLASIFNVHAKAITRLKNHITYTEYYDSFEQLSIDEKLKLAQETKEKYNLEATRANNRRKGVTNALTQEQINYILDNKDKKTRVAIARDLNISADRVGSVIRGISYKDLVANYYLLHN